MKKAALITGAGIRIGEAIAKSLALAGYDIALHYNNSKESSEDLKSELEKFGVECKTFKADFSKEEEILTLFEKVKKVFPYVNVLINNASIFKKTAIKETDADLFNKMISINFKAPYFLLKDFAEHCKSKNGNVINILDTKITKNDFNYSIYTLSKKSLTDLTLMSAKEFGPEIRVNGIAPGVILPPAGEKDEYLDKLIKKIPLKSKGEVYDITEAINYILNNKYMTGQIIFLDGGQHL